MKIYLAGGGSYQRQKKETVEELRKGYPSLEVNLLETFFEICFKPRPILIENYTFTGKTIKQKKRDRKGIG